MKTASRMGHFPTIIKPENKVELNCVSLMTF